MQKTLREKEKMLVTSIFSFSHSVFKIPFHLVVRIGIVWLRIINKCKGMNPQCAEFDLLTQGHINWSMPLDVVLCNRNQ